MQFSKPPYIDWRTTGVALFLCFTQYCSDAIAKGLPSGHGVNNGKLSNSKNIQIPSVTIWNRFLFGRGAVLRKVIKPSYPQGLVSLADNKYSFV
jgi:hypothetical protein